MDIPDNAFDSKESKKAFLYAIEKANSLNKKIHDAKSNDLSIALIYDGEVIENPIFDVTSEGKDSRVTLSEGSTEGKFKYHYVAAGDMHDESGEIYCCERYVDAFFDSVKVMIEVK